MDKTSYTVNNARMVFVVPDGQRHEVMACKVNNPQTMCQVMDIISRLEPYERRAIIVMTTEFEMRSMYPQLHQDERQSDVTRLLDERGNER